jgi:predicted dehydrogenase
VADKKVRIGIVGVGWWAAANHLPILKARDDVELVGVDACLPLLGLG